MKRQTQFIHRVLYDLKRLYGNPVSFFRTSSDPNLRTGKDASDTQVFSFKRVIVLPRDLQQKFVYDLSFIASNKNFTMGGIFDSSARRIILDSRDIGQYIPELRDYFVHQNKRYDIVNIDENAYQTGYTITGAQVEGAVVHNVIPIKVRNRSIFTDSAESEL